LKIIAISDTHGKHWSITIPPGDVLVHAGDITSRGTTDEVSNFNEFLDTLPHEYKIIIAGNHDFCFERNREKSESKLTNCIYLQDQSVIIKDVKFYGSPWQPWFYNWAFNLQRGKELKLKWSKIPLDTNVLITHGPPYGYGDMTDCGKAEGCEDLLSAVKRIKPKVHIFGHIHEGSGLISNENTMFINASTCDSSYSPINPPIVYVYDK
jgi:Icc-related predicted phosphoesterase